MINLRYGQRRIINFTSEQEFFNTLGFLAKSDGTTSLHWENNDECGAWGKEGRIHCYLDINNFPKVLKKSWTKGLGKKVKKRINCNQFVATLFKEYGFVIGGIQDIEVIKKLIPDMYHIYFEEGLKL